MRSWKHTLLTRLFSRPPARPSRPATGIRFRPAVAGLEDRVVPAADLFANATLLGGSFATDVGTNEGATAEDGEVNLPHASGDITSVWWKWTAPTSGWYEVNTFGSEINTVLAVYTGSTLDGLEPVESNDDAGNGVTQSQVGFAAEAGVTYRIAVDGVGGDIGEVYLNLGGAPANDNVGNATVVAGGTVSGSNVLASSEEGEPGAGTSGPVNTVWWAWTAAETGPVTVNTAGSRVGTVLAVYTGTPDSLEYVTESSNASESPGEVAFDAEAGQTYYISVDGRFHLTGAITLNLPEPPASPPPPPPPANTAPTLGDLTIPLAENPAAGAAVADLDATDPDAGQTLTYAITGGNTNGAFAIDPSTGVISVANPAAVDYETTPSFALTVTVTDNGGPRPVGHRHGHRHPREPERRPGPGQLRVDGSRGHQPGGGEQHRDAGLRSAGQCGGQPNHRPGRRGPPRDRRRRREHHPRDLAVLDQRRVHLVRHRCGVGHFGPPPRRRREHAGPVRAERRLRRHGRRWANLPAPGTARPERTAAWPTPPRTWPRTGRRVRSARRPRRPTSRSARSPSNCSS